MVRPICPELHYFLNKEVFQEASDWPLVKKGRLHKRPFFFPMIPSKDTLTWKS
jgi:hypothetical protein